MKQAQSSDGVIHEFPDTTPDAVIDKAMATYARRLRLDAAAAAARANPELKAAREERVDIPSRLWQGMKDPVVGAAQMAWNLMPEGYRNLTPDLNEHLAAKEAQYQQARQSTGQEGVDVARLAGNLVSTVPMAMMTPNLQAAGMGAKMAQGAVLGGGMAALTPETSGQDFWAGKGKQVAAGAAGGALMAPVAAGAARVINPIVDKGKKALMKEGVTLSPGQILGGGMQRLEEKARSVPILGDFIRSAHFKSRDEFNRAAYNRVLEPIGKSYPKGGEVGDEGIAYLKKTLGEEYQKIVPNLKFKADMSFIHDLQKIRTMVQVLPVKQRKVFERYLKDEVFNRMTPKGLMSGESLQTAKSSLGRLASEFRRDQSAYERQVGDALKEVQRSIIRGTARATPEYAAKLKANDAAWQQYKILERAGSAQGADRGFTPAQLSSAVKAKDWTKDKSAFATGKAVMQDLAASGRANIAQTYPDSGTAGRLLDTAAAGYALIDPTPIVALAGAGLAYTRPVQKALQYLMAGDRPALAAPLANAVGVSGPLLGGFAGQSLLDK